MILFMVDAPLLGHDPVSAPSLHGSWLSPAQALGGGAGEAVKATPLCGGKNSQQLGLITPGPSPPPAVRQSPLVFSSHGGQGWQGGAAAGD